MATEKKYLSFDKLSKYHDLLVELVEQKDSVVLQSAKDYAKDYADGLAGNYDAAGSAATVQGKLDEEVTRAKAREDEIAGLVATAQGEVDALEGVVATKAAQSELDALEGLVGELPEDTTATTVVGYVDAKTANIASSETVGALTNRVSTVEGKVATIEGDYLKASDKAELQGKIDLKAAQTDLEAVSAVANAAATQTALQGEINRATGEEARIEGLVTAEAAKAREEEGKLDARLLEVETFFKTADGETIDQAMDTLVEIQKYITEDGAAADQMVKDIAANKKAIEDHAATNHDFASADATLKAELEGKIAEKANTSVVTELSGKVTTAEGKISANEQAIAALQGADTGLGNRISALEGKFGGADGSVEDMIADAKQEAIDAAAGDATTKANKALKDAKDYVDGKDTAMNARVEALEAIDHEHANKALLDTYTQTEANLADAVAKKHAHANADVLNGITSAKVTAWDGKADQTALQAEIERAMAAEKANADAIALFKEITEDEIASLFQA